MGGGGRIKRVGLNEVCTGSKVGLVNGGNQVGASQTEQVIIAFEIAGVVFKALPTVISFCQDLLLNHSAHSAIDQQNLLF